MFEFLRNAALPGAFMPHGYCIQWHPTLLWTYVVSDGLIALAYYSIPFALIWFVRRRTDLPFRWMFILFSIFVLACGTTHILSIWNLWRPMYWWDVTFKGITAGASVLTAALLWPLLPKALRIPSGAELHATNLQLQAEIAERQLAEAQVRRLNDELEQRVEERTTELRVTMDVLRAQIVEREQAQLTQREAEERYQTLIERSPEPILVHVDGALAYVNPACVRLLGAHTADELLGRPALDIVHPSEHPIVRERIRVQVEEGKAVPVMEQRYVRLDGGIVDVEVNSAIFSYGGKRAVQVFARDISQRKQAEQRAARISNLYAALSQTNAAIVRVQSQQTLFAEVCRIAVEAALFSGAAVVQAEPQSLMLRPVASAGNCASFIEAAEISIEPGTRHIIQAAGALRDHGYWVSNDFLADPDNHPWHAGFAAAGFRSTAMFSLRNHVEVVGGLMLFSDEVNVFDADMINLLMEMSSDISFALEALDREARRRTAERMLVSSRQQLRLALEASEQGLWEWNIATNSMYFDLKWAELHGCRIDDVAPSVEGWKRLVHPDDLPELDNALSAHLKGQNELVEAEYRTLHKNGEWIWIGVRGKIVERDPEELAVKLTGVAQDISQRKRDDERMAYLAQYDPLTNLPNRSLFRDRLAQAMLRAHRSTQRLALVFLDVDQFKHINDTLGHLIGDRVLQTISTRLKTMLREVDTIARLGGDEFTIILEEMADRAEVVGIVQKVFAVFSEPIQIELEEVFVSASLGITLYPDDADSLDELLKQADLAMYRAKHEGRNTYSFFSKELQQHSMQRLQLEGALRRALVQDEFVLHYQPKVELKTGRIVGAEALLRWKSPEHGLVGPNEFIPAAEESGLIVPIGAWVLSAACQQYQAWHLKGLDRISLAINLSPRQFRQKDLTRTIREVVEAYAVPPARLEFEITENMMMQPDAEIILNELQAMGVGLAIDDFGTGYANLAFIKRFRMHTLKIDRSFIQGIPGNTEDVSLVRTIVGMAKSLAMAVLAEGVETREQADFLRSIDCDLCQGYFFGRPVPAEAFEAMIQAASQDPPVAP